MVDGGLTSDKPVTYGETSDPYLMSAVIYSPTGGTIGGVKIASPTTNITLKVFTGQKVIEKREICVVYLRDVSYRPKWRSLEQLTLASFATFSSSKNNIYLKSIGAPNTASISSIVIVEKIASCIVSEEFHAVEVPIARMIIPNPYVKKATSGIAIEYCTSVIAWKGIDANA